MTNIDSNVTGLHLIMGWQCNARCVMCYQTDFSTKHNMPPVIYLEHLAGLYPSLRNVRIQGGEPTIMPNCAEFARHMRQFNGVKLDITTNGIRVSDFWMDTFINQSSRINFSLNAASAEAYDMIVKQGNFRNVLKNIEMLIKARRGDKPVVSISSVIVAHNALELAAIVELGDKLGVDFIEYIIDPILSFNGLPERGEMVRQLSKTQETIDRLKMRVAGLDVFARKFGMDVSKSISHKPNKICPVPFNHLLVDFNGDVLVCCRTWKVIGNTYKAGMDEILKGAKLRAFQKKVTNNDYIWCSPWCYDNPAPKRSAIISKYLTLIRQDPKYFFKKVSAKYKKMR
ncbi:MAG: radical SAM/SPASM domain-containing protein [Deltaproteobacteria bacterium]